MLSKSTYSISSLCFLLTDMAEGQKYYQYHSTYDMTGHYLLALGFILINIYNSEYIKKFDFKFRITFLY